MSKSCYNCHACLAYIEFWPTCSISNHFCSYTIHIDKPIDHLICNHFSRKVVLEKWFWKLGFFFLVNHFYRTRKKIRVCRTTFLQPEKRWIYSINQPFFLVNHFSQTRKKIRVFRTTFLEPDFSKKISRTTFLHFSRKVVAD